MNAENIRKYSLVAIAGFILSCLAIEPTFAQGLAGIEGVLQNVQNTLTGTLAKTIAIIAVVFVGFAWMFGYLDLRKAMYCVVGIAIVFGAPQIVGMLGA